MLTAATTALGTILVILGVVLLVLPGPGLLLIAAGLALLARNFTWAEDLLHRARTSLDQRRTRPVPRGAADGARDDVRSTTTRGARTTPGPDATPGTDAPDVTGPGDDDSVQPAA